MDLAKRLAQFDALLRAPRRAEGPGGPGPRGADVSGANDLERDAAAAMQRAVCRLALTPREGPAGTAWACETVGEAPGPPPGPAQRAALAGVVAPRDGSGSALFPADGDLLLLDTETTGLAGGTGTVPFLIGSAWWEGNSLRTRQWFLPAPGQEGPLLADLAALARRFAAVVTYNGQTFDLPLLRTRALLARQRDPLADLPGYDLLRATRRLWGRGLPDCRQPTVEAAVCGIARAADDIPGALIPHVYFGYLRSGDPGDLPLVVAHNRRDLHGMAAILAAAGERAVALERSPAGRLPAGLSWTDGWSAVRLHERLGRWEQAAAWAAGALAAVVSPAAGESTGAAPERFFVDVVRALKRRRDWAATAGALAEALASVGDRPWIHREAAILYEHRLRDLSRAWAHAQRLREPARLARLRRKLGDIPSGSGEDATSSS